MTISFFTSKDEIHLADTDKQLRYKLWSKIESIFPELDIATGDWRLNTSEILTPVLIRKSLSQNTYRIDFCIDCFAGNEEF